METSGGMSLSALTFRFKSYYVVWKLANLGRIIPIAIGFKSYYVVWKPFVKETPQHPLSRLNRTM